jgi:hypothetical protein
VDVAAERVRAIAGLTRIRLELEVWKDEIAVMPDRLVRTPVAAKPKLLDQVWDVLQLKLS